jgi:hypothetical protein
MANDNLTLDDLRCHDCAFRPGSTASQSAITRVKAQLCAEIPEEFEGNYVVCI